MLVIKSWGEGTNAAPSPLTPHPRGKGFALATPLILVPQLLLLALISYDRNKLNLLLAFYSSRIAIIFLFNMEERMQERYRRIIERSKEYDFERYAKLAIASARKTALPCFCSSTKRKESN
jgi:hypothetical protein